MKVTLWPGRREDKRELAEVRTKRKGGKKNMSVKISSRLRWRRVWKTM